MAGQLSAYGYNVIENPQEVCVCERERTCAYTVYALFPFQ